MNYLKNLSYNGALYKKRLLISVKIKPSKTSQKRQPKNQLIDICMHSTPRPIRTHSIPFSFIPKFNSSKFNFFSFRKKTKILKKRNIKPITKYIIQKTKQNERTQEKKNFAKQKKKTNKTSEERI